MTNHLKTCKPYQDTLEMGRVGPVASTPIPQVQQTLIADAFRSLYSPDQFQENLLRMVVLQDLPFNHFENPSVQTSYKYGNPKANFLAGETVRNRLMKQFKGERRRQIEYWSKAGSKVSFSLDIWSSPNRRSFLGICAHFIDQEWNCVSAVLDMVPFDTKHTGEALFKRFLWVLETFKVTNKLLGLAVDNATNNDKMVKLLIRSRTAGFTAEQHIR